jgi:nucleoside-diphosphate-sugar epimerase
MNLVIGNTSQLSYYFPDDYVKISSRNINLKNFDNLESVYITFAEQRTFNKELSEKDFIDVNVDYTSKLIDSLSPISKKVFVYGTAELWNNINGPVNINKELDYKYSPYVKSKEILWNTIREKRNSENWQNVSIIHPFNFNSLYRKEGFLFYKFYDSLINKTIHQVGNINMYRDIIHPSYLVKKSIECDGDELIGSGKVINIREFIDSLFNYYGLQMIDYIKEDSKSKSNHQDNTFWMETDSAYNGLLTDTVTELNKIIKNEQHKISQ